jgi:hypothetical protein
MTEHAERAEDDQAAGAEVALRERAELDQRMIDAQLAVDQSQEPDSEKCEQ